MISLKELLKQHGAANTTPIDRFLLFRYFDKYHPKIFSKGGLYRAIEHHVPRPDYIDFEVPDIQADITAEKLQQTLEEHKVAYLKDVSSTVGGGSGVIKIILLEDEVKLVIPHRTTRDILERRLGRLFQDESDDFIHFIGHGFSHSDRVSLPIMKTMRDQPLQKILSTLLKHALQPGEYVIEAPINIPLYNNRTWEIRNIVQCPSGVPQITARYTKVGAGQDFSNILLGGEAEDPLTVITHIYQTHRDVNQATAQQLAQEYLSANDKVTLEAATALSAYMRTIAREHLQDIEPQQFYAREFSVDITAEFNTEGIISPIVGELQYPLGCYASYTPELMKTDPQKLDLIREINESMEDEDRKLIEQRYFLN